MQKIIFIKGAHAVVKKIFHKETKMTYVGKFLLTDDEEVFFFIKKKN